MAPVPAGSAESTVEIPRREVAALTEDKQAADRYGAELSQAWGHFHLSAFEEALALFEQVASASDATPPDRIQALFGLGLTRSHRRPFPDPAGAEAAFREIIERYPDNATVPWAMIELGNLVNVKAAGHSGAAAARNWYRDVLERRPGSLAAHEAALRLANSLFYELEPPQSTTALQLLEEHLERHPDNPLATVMLFRLDYWYAQILLQYERALPFAEALSAAGMSDPFRWSRQFWHTAEIHRLALNQPQKAIPWYRRIVEETPGSIHSLSAKQMLDQLELKEAAP